MKKHMTKLFSLLMALCMVGALLVPSALAASCSNANETAESRAVASRMRVGAQYVMAAPAYISETTGELLYYDLNEISEVDVYPSATEQNGSCRLSRAETTAVLNKFKTRFKVDANAWILAAMYSIHYPGDGSYSKYFQFDTVGNSLIGNEVRVDVGRNDPTCAIVGIFGMPENTSGTYNVGLHGGFYYYSAAAKKELSSMVHIDAYFNSTF